MWGGGCNKWDYPETNIQVKSYAVATLVRGVQRAVALWPPEASPQPRGCYTHFWQPGQKVEVRPATLMAVSFLPQVGQGSPALP